MAARKRKKIVFVCTGNTCRSPMAQLLLSCELKKRNLSGFNVRSAGISAQKGDVINPKSAEVLQENAIGSEGFVSTRLTEKLLSEAFAVICMTERQREYLMDMRWNALKKVGKTQDAEVENNVYSFAEITGYEILDPYGKDIDCYRYVFGLLAAGIPKLIEKLRLQDHAWEKKPKTSVKEPKKKTAQIKTKKKTLSKKQKTESENEQLSIF